MSKIGGLKVVGMVVLVAASLTFAHPVKAEDEDKKEGKSKAQLENVIQDIVTREMIETMQMMAEKIVELEESIAITDEMVMELMIRMNRLEDRKATGSGRMKWNLVNR